MIAYYTIAFRTTYHIKNTRSIVDRKNVLYDFYKI